MGQDCRPALLSGSNGVFAELLEEFFDFERDFAGTCACSLVAVLYLGLSVFCESFEIRSELFNESFHR